MSVDVLQCMSVYMLECKCVWGEGLSVCGGLGCGEWRWLAAGWDGSKLGAGGGYDGGWLVGREERGEERV